ncbi:MAG: hypothetical protein A3G38_02840 [Omnitrophica WOR_2 bacterium RIFCSPLOWO2_12_FULL_51_8]|nr:MAG: hypothetical protein A3G38_02840 [Omnitrophica WOR_2 bacterium RIFCSPLOWO2_12_FULL_51_8]
MTGLNVTPVSLQRAILNSGKLWISTSGYNPLLEFDPATGRTTRIGYPRLSNYDLLLDGNDLYLAGYPAMAMRYRMDQPWTLTPSNFSFNPTTPTSNPYQIPPHVGKYYYYSAKGADGFIYFAIHHERDSTGGDLGWYDPRTGNYGNLREPFINDDTRDLDAILGGTKILYSSSSGAGRLFVIDPATKSVERVITVPNGVRSQIVEVEPGIVVGAGLSGDKQSSYIYRINVSTGEFQYMNRLPAGGKVFGSNISYSHQRIVLGPDGYVWIFVGDSLYRINPADGALQKILDTPSRSLIFYNGDLYLYGVKELQRIRGILTSSGDISGDGSVSAYDAGLALEQGRGALEAAHIAQQAVS